MKKRNVVLILAFALLCIMLMPGLSYGEKEPGVIIEGNKCGLKVEAISKKVNTDNLNPGDKLYTRLKLTNEGSNPLTLSIRTNILKERSPRGGQLADIMNLRILDETKDNTINDDLVRKVAKQGNTSIGKMAPGSTKILEFYVNLPGAETDNQYQGAYLKINWTLTTQCSATGGDHDPGGDPGDKDKDPGGRDPGGKDPHDEGKKPEDVPEHEIEIEEDPIPTGPGEPEIPFPDDGDDGEIIITVEDDEIPKGPGLIPKVGEVSKIYFLGAGFILLILGYSLRKNDGPYIGGLRND